MKRLHMVSALCIALVFIKATASHAAAISGQGTWETTLQARDLDGNPATAEAYYDTDLDITWLADANYAQSSGYDTDSLMIWDTAVAWAAGLNINGYTSWRLPNTNPVTGVTYNYNTSYNGTTDYGYNVSAPGTTYAGRTGSEMAHLYYNTLGNKGYSTVTSVYPFLTIQSGWGLSNTGPFSNIQTDNYPDFYYWSATQSSGSSDRWVFSFYGGYQSYDLKTNALYGWAVHDGDVGTAIVPLPAAVWLFGSGLLGLIGIAKRNKVF